MNQPVVTVITPAYNVAKYLSATIASVVGQSFRDFEYLIINDGSVDQTPEVADAAAASDSRIRVFHTENRGSSAARNIGLKHARGRYIAFVDGDDYWDPTFLQVMVSAIELAPSTTRGVMCHSRSFIENRESDDSESELARDSYNLNQVLVAWNPIGNGSAAIFRTSAFEESGYFNEQMRSAVDLEMFLRILEPNDRYIYEAVHKSLVNYRIRPNSISADKNARFEAMRAIIRRFGYRLSTRQRACFVQAVQVGARADAPFGELAKLTARSLPFGIRPLLFDRYNGLHRLALSRFKRRVTSAT